MSAAVAAAATAVAIATRTRNNNSSGSSSRSASSVRINNQQSSLVLPVPAPPGHLNRYESQKRRDWNTFGQYLRNHRPPLALARCSGAHVLEFLRYLDQFGKTKVHNPNCPFFGQPHQPAPCRCPLKQAWGSLDAIVGRLRAAFEENGGHSDSNPFGTMAVRLYLREVRDCQARARGIAYEKKKRSRKQPTEQLHLPQQRHQQQQMQMLGHQLQFSSEVSSSNEADHEQAELGHIHGYPSQLNEALMVVGLSDPEVSSMNMIPLYATN